MAIDDVDGDSVESHDPAAHEAAAPKPHPMKLRLTKPRPTI